MEVQWKEITRVYSFPIRLQQSAATRLMPKQVIDCLAVVNIQSLVVLMILILLLAASVQLVKQLKNMQKGSIFNQEILEEIGDLT